MAEGRGHSKTLCWMCLAVIRQCRCPSPVKQVIYGLCSACEGDSDPTPTPSPPSPKKK